jgi:hypothetical protein
VGDGGVLARPAPASASGSDGTCAGRADPTLFRWVADPVADRSVRAGKPAGSSADASIAAAPAFPTVDERFPCLPLVMRWGFWWRPNLEDAEEPPKVGVVVAAPSRPSAWRPFNGPRTEPHKKQATSNKQHAQLPTRQRARQAACDIVAGSMLSSQSKKGSLTVGRRWGVYGAMSHEAISLAATRRAAPAWWQLLKRHWLAIAVLAVVVGRIVQAVAAATRVRLLEWQLKREHRRNCTTPRPCR